MIPADGWMNWNALAEARGWGLLERAKNAANPTYELRGEKGRLVLVSGSRVAFWNGTGIGLGFGARLSDGELMVHWLDAAKNFQPLLEWPVSQRRTRVVVLDPGHGGKDAGAKSVFNDVHENELTLDWALRAKPLLERRGWRVYLTRTNDIFLTLSERVAFADRAQGEVFISLHFNSVNAAAARPEHRGIETYCLTPAGMPSNLVREREDNLAAVYPNNAFDLENFQYALRLHRKVVELTGANDRGVRRARFMTVLQGQSRPAVLVEGGFLSNPQEAKQIATAAYRQRLAEAVAAGLEDF